MYTILGIIAKPLGWAISFIYGLIGNYGLSIILFTLIVKFLLYPLYIKQTKSTVAMAEIQPKMQAIQRKYANDSETMNMKLAEARDRLLPKLMNGEIEV
jgi:YidC/Oxa1 family membrane protein insertase